MENDSQAVTRVPSIEAQPQSIPQFTQLSPTKDLDLLEPSRTVTPSVRSFDAVPPRRSGWDLRPFHGMITDVRRRLPYYWSDWKDAWTYRVIPATAMIFFANILPGIAFSLDLIETTNQYGVTEVLLSSFMAAFIFSVFACQPLAIAGVTGPITVLNKTIYDILKTHSDAPNYLHFIGWVYLWAAILHWIAAIFNAANFLRYVTRFSCDTFGFYVSWVYLQYGVQVLTRQFSESPSGSEGAYVSIILALILLTAGHLFVAAAQSTFFHRIVRRFFADYGMPISGTVIEALLHSGLAYWGRFNASNPATLPTAGAFNPAGGREWLVRFWELPAKWVGIAFPFGLVLFILFFFDHNVSSLIAQGSEFPLRKPPGFHWDFFWLGITTFIAGLIGVPAPNGLIPQAPMHTQSLVVMGLKTKYDEEVGVSADGEKALGGVREGVEHPVAVVEQRGVLAGLFWFMGTDALRGSGVTAKFLYLIQDDSLVPLHEPLRKVRPSMIWLFLAIELVGFGATMAITQTIAAIGFPIVIFLLIPIRTHVIPLLPFTLEELAILDGPTASPFTMESVGGSI
ncbi:hypothetical protein FRC04_004519 [Tulasnella sp. 424]|nr:hypothetical protein FRC04_004519 [Tulasnella sp. 424]